MKLDSFFWIWGDVYARGRYHDALFSGPRLIAILNGRKPPITQRRSVELPDFVR